MNATGGLIIRITQDGDSENVVFLYEGVIHTGNDQFSVCQMITDVHHTNCIKKFLSEFVRLGAMPPKETVCDMSKALLTAIVQTFTCFKTMNNYADACATTDLPPCYGRLDVAHFKHLYVLFLKDKRPALSKLFKIILDLIILSRTVSEVSKRIRQFLTICRSEFEVRNVDGSMTQSELVKEDLKIILSREEIIKYDENKQNEKELLPEAEEKSTVETLKTKGIKKFIKVTIKIKFCLTLTFS